MNEISRLKTTKNAAQPYVKAWRKLKGLSQERLADILDMSPPSISQLENGKQGYSDKTLAALAHAFDCDVGDLFRDPNAPQYQVWRIISRLPARSVEKAIRVLELMVDDAA